MPRKKAAKFTCRQCGKEFAMAMHQGRHMTTIHGQASKTAKRKKATKVAARKAGPAGRPLAIVGGLGLRDLTLERLAAVVTSVREEAARRIAQIQEVLLPATPTRTGRAPGRPVAAGAPKAPAKRTRRKPRKFKLTGSASILTFVKNKGARGATTAEIVRNWKSQGRSGDGYTAIGELVKAKKLKREPLKGKRGSRYVMA